MKDKNMWSLSQKEVTNYRKRKTRWRKSMGSRRGTCAGTGGSHTSTAANTLAIGMCVYMCGCVCVLLPTVM